jgi:hypothetical protein
MSTAGTGPFFRKNAVRVSALALTVPASKYTKEITAVRPNSLLFHDVPPAWLPCLFLKAKRGTGQDDSKIL